MYIFIIDLPNNKQLLINIINRIVTSHIDLNILKYLLLLLLNFAYFKYILYTY